MDATNAKLMETLCSSDNWSDATPFLSSFSASRKKFDHTCIATRSYFSSHVDFNSLEVDGAIVAYSKDAVEMAGLLGDITLPEKGESNWILIPRHMVEGDCSDSRLCNAANALVENLDVVFDERTDASFAYTEQTRIWWHPTFRYCADKQLPDELGYVFCRNRFLSLIEAVWNDSFIIRPRLAHESKSIKTISRASTIANLLLLDRGHFDVFAKKGKCPAWQVSTLKKLEISSPSALSPNMQDVYHEVERLQDVADFWMNAADMYGWALRLATSDLEDDRIEETKEKIAVMAQLINLESYLDAYDAGVPASDLLA